MIINLNHRQPVALLTKTSCLVCKKKGSYVHLACAKSFFFPVWECLFNNFPKWLRSRKSRNVWKFLILNSKECFYNCSNFFNTWKYLLIILPNSRCFAILFDDSRYFLTNSNISRLFSIFFTTFEVFRYFSKIQNFWVILDNSQ